MPPAAAATARPDDVPAGARPEAASDAARLARRRRQRLQAQAMVAGNYTVDTLLLLALAAAGVFALEVPLVYAAATALSVALFAAVYASPLCDHAEDHYLGQYQLAVNIAINIAFVSWVPQAGWLMLMLCFVIFGFAALRMGARRALTAAVLVSVLMGAVVALHGERFSVPMDGVAQRLLSGLWCSLVLMRMALLGLYGARLRALLSNRNQQLARAFEQLEQLAHRDDLTGALNRRRVMQVLREERERMQRSAQPFGIALFDLDHFKRINDDFGHVVGDEVLRRFVAVAQEKMRATDRLGRWGGEEFLMVVPGAGDPRQAGALAERVRAGIESQDWPSIEPELSVTVSAGVAICGPNDTDEDLLARADAALYEAKRVGRNRVLCVRSPGAEPPPAPAAPPAPMAPLADTVADAETI